MFRARPLIVLAFLLVTFHAAGQITFPFTDGDIALWGIEGDGSLALETMNGNPGNSLRVNEPAAGTLNYVIAHPGMGGDWSQTAVTDVIQFDLFAHEFSGSPLASPGYLVELRGPGGVANTLIDWAPSMDVWQTVVVTLSPGDWTMVSGTWSGLLANVEVVRIRAEFIQGDEYVLLDNIGLSFTPVVLLQGDQVCSTWETDEGLDGWNFQNTGSITVSTTNGNPPNAVQIADQSNVISTAYAPPKFRGDLSAWNGSGYMRFDLRINTSLTAYAVQPQHVRLAGPGGAATMPITVAEIQQATNQWRTFTYPLDAGAWTVTSGTWNALLANVNVIELTLEYYNGTAETVLLDNFCMGIITLRLHALLDGPLDGGTGLMNDALRTMPGFPVTEPFTALGYTHVGGGGSEALMPALLSISGPNAITDWVVVELRSALDPSVVVATRSAVIERDGDVMATSGGPLTAFGPDPEALYFIALRHRNHLGVMTLAAMSLQNGIDIDLIDPATPVHGIDARRLQGGMAVFWAGDVTMDGEVKYTGTGNDRDPVLAAVGGTVPTNTATGYLSEDVNLDGVVKYTGTGNDRDPILVTIGGTVPTNVRQEQVP